MKIGMCGSLDLLDKVAQMGYDYLEVAVVSVVGLTDEEFAEKEKLVAASPIKCEAFNVLFPGTIRLTGEDVKMDEIGAYLNKAFDRVSRLGGKKVVLGSGGARKVPEGFSMDKAWEQLREVLRLAGDVAAKYGVTVVLEPLNKGETNIINSVADGYKLVKEVDHPSVKLLTDLYHVRLENEPVESMADYGDELRHAHIARAEGRHYPLTADEEQYTTFFAALKKGGYTGAVSVEGRCDDFDIEAPISLKLLRELTA